MTSLAALAQRLAADHIDILGGLHPGPDDGLPEDIRTLLLLGPL